MPSVIRVEEQRHGTTVVASLDGELDASSVGDVAVRVRRLVQNRELRLVGSSIAGAWTGDQLTGQISSTYNVFTTGSQPIGVGSLIATHNITATRR